MTQNAPVWDPQQWTAAAISADKGREVPQNLMSYASTKRGRPSAEERSLYLGALSFTYAVWENYVEELAQELVDVLAEELPPERIPDEVKAAIIDHVNANSWELAVHPGWRGLWKRLVTQRTVGDEATSYGLNTANTRNVTAIFKLIGIDPMPLRISKPSDPKTLPPNISVKHGDQIDVPNALNQLISLRGEAVHTASTQSVLYKREVLWWNSFVYALYCETDTRARNQVAGLLA